MGVGTFIFLGIVVVAAFYFITIYNNLVRIKHNVSQAWSNIDILLKQRHDELPKLVEVCKQYMQYEALPWKRLLLLDPVWHRQENQVISALWVWQKGN